MLEYLRRRALGLWLQLPGEGERERMKVSCFSNGRLPKGLSLLQVALERIRGSTKDYLVDSFNGVMATISSIIMI